MRILKKNPFASHAVFLAVVAVAMLAPGAVMSDHIGPHATPCDQAATVGGGTLGVSPGPVGPPNSLGWDVGGGQCNGSFSATTDGSFPGGALELALRAEQRRIGQVAPTGPNDYTVQTGPDVGPPAALSRAWWNFQGSIAYGGSIASLDALTLEIVTDVGPNLPVAPVVDLLAIRFLLDARNNQPNPTTGFADLFQFSQNPEFGWFFALPDTDANPTGAFDYDAPGAWRFKLTAIEGGTTASVSVCIHTPGAACAPADQDTDGVPDGLDVCPDTAIPELGVPSRRLGTNRFALVDGDGVFDTKAPRGRGPGRSFTIEDTAGCSCEQIIAALDLGDGHVKFGCSIGAMENWVDLVNPLADVSTLVVGGTAPRDVFTADERRARRREARRARREARRLEREERRLRR